MVLYHILCDKLSFLGEKGYNRCIDRIAWYKKLWDELGVWANYIESAQTLVVEKL